MRIHPNILIILAAMGLAIGLILRLMRGGLADPVFFWRGSMALLVLAIALQVVQRGNK